MQSQPKLKDKAFDSDYKIRKKFSLSLSEYSIKVGQFFS